MMIVVIAYLVASHGREILETVRRMQPIQLVLVTGLALVTLVARTEAVVACLSAMKTRPRRVDLHAANSLTFLASTINHYVSSIVRGVLVRRLDPGRSPTIPQMVVVDTATGLIEALVVAVLIVASAGTLKLAWWIPLLVLCAGGAALTVALVVRRRLAHFPLLRGLDVFGNPRQRIVVAVLMLAVIAAQVVRTLVVLQAAGLHPSLIQAVATLVAGGVLSSLFAGPGAGTAAGPLLVFGKHSLAASTAAGLVLSVTMLIAGLVYAAPGGPTFLVRLRSRRA
ncbi:MAG: hypothetical protein WAK93_12760 [Solirubrobacteraceae bacterium]